MTTKTGGGGGPWVTLERPKPPKVDDHYLYWGEQPPELSERCRYWVRQIKAGWRPNRKISGEGYDSQSEWYGVYIWELMHVLWPLLHSIGPNTGNAHGGPVDSPVDADTPPTWLTGCMFADVARVFVLPARNEGKAT